MRRHRDRLPPLRRARGPGSPLLRPLRLHPPARNGRPGSRAAADPDAVVPSPARPWGGDPLRAPTGADDGTSPPGTLADREAVPALPDADRAGSGVLPRMPEPARAVRSGRRGRRTASMVRIARERIDDLFGLAAQRADLRDLAHADRYVRLAREIGRRYNVRLLREYREFYCRGCSSYWVEGRTVRTRVRSGRRIRTCLVCGRIRRARHAAPETPGARAPLGRSEAASDRDEGLSGPAAISRPTGS